MSAPALTPKEWMEIATSRCLSAHSIAIDLEHHLANCTENPTIMNIPTREDFTALRKLIQRAEQAVRASEEGFLG